MSQPKPDEFVEDAVVDEDDTDNTPFPNTPPKEG